MADDVRMFYKWGHYLSVLFVLQGNIAPHISGFPHLALMSQLPTKSNTMIVDSLY